MNCTLKDIIALRDCILDGAYEGYDNYFISNDAADIEVITDYIISGILNNLDRKFSLEVIETKRNTNN